MNFPANFLNFSAYNEPGLERLPLLLVKASHAELKQGKLNICPLNIFRSDAFIVPFYVVFVVIVWQLLAILRDRVGECLMDGLGGHGRWST